MQRKLSQEWLDRVAGFVFSGDVDAFVDHFSLPLAILSDTQASTIETRDGLIEKFRAWQNMFAALAVTSMERTVRDVIDFGPTRIVAQYGSDVLSRGQRVMPRFESVLVLELQGTTWRCSEIVTGLGAADRHLIHANETDGRRAAE